MHKLKIDSLKPNSPQLTQDAASLVSTYFDDVYRSKQGEILEVEEVFIKGNTLEERWLESHRSFVIAELGFGTGLSALVTALHWNRLCKENVLSFISIEGFPLNQAQLKNFYLNFFAHNSNTTNVELKNLADELTEKYPQEPTKGAHRIWLGNNSICLTLLFHQAQQALSTHSFYADAWYLDGFSPKKNKEMWDEEIFTLISSHTKEGGSFATYAAASAVKRNAQNAGFEITAKKGFLKKREMLCGTKPGELSVQSSKRKVAIIGAGLAGVSTYLSLKRRGFEATIFEKEKAPASQASGNEMAVMMPHLSQKIDHLTEYYLSGYLYALRTIKEILQDELCTRGVLRIANVNKWKSICNKFNELGYDSIATLLSSDDVLQKFNLRSEDAALFFQEAISLPPAKLINTLLCNSTDVFYNTKIESISVEKNQVILNNNSESIFDYVIIANAHDAHRFEISKWVPIEKIKGQLFSCNIDSLKLQTSVCYDGYITPLDKENRFLIGATYEHNAHEEVFDEKVVEDLIARFSPYVSQKPELQNIQGRVCFRTTCPDRMPSVGCLENSRVFCSLGHGSRGLSSALLAGEIIGDLINETPVCLSDETLAYLDPKRFLHRAKKREMKLEEIYPASYEWREKSSA